jgi:hypothetical protein
MLKSWRVDGLRELYLLYASSRQEWKAESAPRHGTASRARNVGGSKNRPLTLSHGQRTPRPWIVQIYSAAKIG